MLTWWLPGCNTSLNWKFWDLASLVVPDSIESSWIVADKHEAIQYFFFKI